MLKLTYQGKKAGIGRNRSHAQNRTPRKFKVNLQKKTFFLDGEKVTGEFSAKQIKRLKMESGTRLSHKASK